MLTDLQRSSLPRILCVGGEALNRSHGTGLMIERHFSKYPSDRLVDICYQKLGTGKILKKNIYLPFVDASDRPGLRNMLSRAGRSHSMHRFFKVPNIEWSEYGGPPDLIYSTCYSTMSFSFLYHVYMSLPKKVPIVNHFLDLDLSHMRDLVRQYDCLRPAIVDTWALNDNIAESLRKYLKVKPELVHALQHHLSPDFKTYHAEYSSNFRPAIIGNIWSGSAFRTLVAIWKMCRESIPSLPDVAWAGHPRRFDVFKSNDVNWGRSQVPLKDVGYLSASGLKQFLCSADIGIVAFSGTYVDDQQYDLHSLPSRIGDYCANGLPVVVIGRPNTPPWQLVKKHGLGIAIDPNARDMAAKALTNFILDREWRQECGLNARKFAERELDLERYQSELIPRLQKLAKHKIDADSFLRPKYRRQKRWQ